MYCSPFRIGMDRSGNPRSAARLSRRQETRPRCPGPSLPFRPEMEAARLDIPRGLDALGGVDWSFASEPPAHPLHGLHPYPAKFVPALPRILIELLSEPGDLIMDPFVGSGTALVEALLLGRRAIGGDLNPVA